MLRLVLGVLLAPLLTAALVTLAAWGVYLLTESDPLKVANMTAEAGWIALVGFYEIALLGGVAAIPYLWSSRRRSRWPWLFAGVFAGGFSSLVAMGVYGDRFSVIALVAASLFGALIFLVMRWITGIRPVASPDDLS